MKNIFKDPIGWAMLCAGSAQRYHFLQICTAVGGLLLCWCIFLIVDPKFSLGQLAGIFILLLVVTIEVPLLYLRAIRVLLQQREQLSGGPQETK